jgi:hypothetical protein
MSAQRQAAQKEQKASKSNARGTKIEAKARTPKISTQTPNQGLRTNTQRNLDKQSQGGQRVMATARKASKQQLVLGLLSAANGASISELMAGTNWLPHSIRAVLSRLRKQGYVFDRQKAEGGPRYKLLAAPSIEVRA